MSLTLSRRTVAFVFCSIVPGWEVTFFAAQSTTTCCPWATTAHTTDMATTITGVRIRTQCILDTVNISSLLVWDLNGPNLCGSTPSITLAEQGSPGYDFPCL